jgi:isoleucyl-tRNA synthetase
VAAAALALMPADDRADSIRRRSVRTVSDEIFRRVVTWFAPILCFTMEEAWTTRFPDQSVHLHDFFAVPADWADTELLAKWKRLRELRRAVTGALELQRAEKLIGSSLEASVTLQLADPADLALFDTVDLTEIAITSAANVVTLAQSDAPPGFAAVEIVRAEGEKCDRCWRVLPEVVANTQHICNRCTHAVAG